MLSVRKPKSDFSDTPTVGAAHRVQGGELLREPVRARAAVGRTGYRDPSLAACEETGTVISMHVGSSGNVNRLSSYSPRQAGIALSPGNGMQIDSRMNWTRADGDPMGADFRFVTG